MQPEVPAVSAATPLDDLRDLFLERSYRFVIVEEPASPPGSSPGWSSSAGSSNTSTRPVPPSTTGWPGVRPISQPIARPFARLRSEMGAAPPVRRPRGCRRQGVSVYLVGGMVRDLLLERANEDVDLVVEGDGIAFAADLAKSLDGRRHPHEPFLTAVVTLPDGLRVDVASARTEFYRTPAALPEVATSLIRQDLVPPRLHHQLACRRSLGRSPRRVGRLLRRSQGPP